ncbi:MAG: hypothetical protein EPO00_01250, partial [Chloroflexota bacterium]
MAKTAAPKPIPTITHDDVLEAHADWAGVPPYDVSEWATDKTQAELFDEIQRRRNVKRATGGLLDHSDLTLEMLWAESGQRARRSPAEIAGQPKPNEAETIALAESAYLDANRAHLLALDDRRNAADRYGRALAEATGRTYDRSGNVTLPADWQLQPSQIPADVAIARRTAEAAAARVEATYKASGEALVALNATRRRIMGAAEARQRDVQIEINDAG